MTFPSCPLLVTFRIGFVDALAHIVGPVSPSAGLVIVRAGPAVFLDRRPGPVDRARIACCVATMIAIGLKDDVEHAVGRLRPETRVADNPFLIRDGADGFVPLHGGRGWFAFPSGHTRVITAPIPVLWGRLPRWRSIPPILVALVVAGLFGADYHVVGDMVAGLCLGVACGVGALALLREPAGTELAPPP